MNTFYNFVVPFVILPSFFMSYFSNDPNSDKITAIKNEVEAAKNVVTENIEKLIERGEKIELLDGRKTNELTVRSRSVSVSVHNGHIMKSNYFMLYLLTFLRNRKRRINSRTRRKR